MANGTKHRIDPAQLELDAVARWVTIEPVLVRQPDGNVLVKPGKVTKAAEWITVREASRLLSLSRRRIAAMVDEGAFGDEGIDWKRPGTGVNGKLWLSREAVMRRLGAREMTNDQ